MSLSLLFYKKNQEQVIHDLQQLVFLLDDLQDINKKKRVEDLIQDIYEDKFQLAVVGEFSRGKSTFINALLGKRLLPSSTKPTTATLNKISYSSKPYIRVHYREDARSAEDITEERFSMLVAPKDPIQGNVASEAEYTEKVRTLQSIQYVDIGYSLSFCENGVEIIDTPGINDLDPAREQITNNIIPKSDAAIFLLSATKLLSESEMNFLKYRLLKNDIQKIFIVINFKDDLKTDDDIQKVLQRAYDRLQPILHHPKIFLVAAKQALNARRVANGEEIKSTGRRPLKIWPLEQSGFLELEQDLSDFLQYERGAVKLQKPIQIVVKLIDQIDEKNIQFEKATLTNKIDEFQQEVEACRKTMQRVEQVGKEALRKIDVELKKKEQELAGWYDVELQAISNKALEAFDEKRTQLSTNQLANYIEEVTAPLERELHITKIKKQEETFKRVVEDMSQQVNEEWGKLDARINEMLQPQSTEIIEATEISYTKDSSNVLVVFDSIFEELDTAWANSSSFLGKVAVGAGYAATLIVGGVTAILSFGFSWLFGEDEKTKMRRQLVEQFNESKRTKSKAWRREWKELSKCLSIQYEKTIHQQVTQVEKQLQQLLDNQKLSEDEIQVKMERLYRQKRKLLQIKNSLLTISNKLVNRKEEVEI